MSRKTRSGEVRDNAKQTEGLATSRIAYAEARAAFARRRREEGLSRAGYRAVVNDLDQTIVREMISGDNHKVSIIVVNWTGEKVSQRLLRDRTMGICAPKGNYLRIGLTST
jgi:hypothetical protein